MTVRPRILLQDVAPRDGLQSETRFVPTADKVALVDALSASGLAAIEVTSFVSPRAVPALADAAEVMAAIRRAPGVAYGVLVPNLRGAHRALPLRPDEFNLVMSASDAHNRANLRRSCADSVAESNEIVRLARAYGIRVRVSLSCAFGCPYEGDVAAERVLALIAHWMEQEIEGITLCDTTGMAFPAQVTALCEAFARRWPLERLALHFHNSRGLGLANVLAGTASGVRRFDSSLGGIGGCPFAPGATGNVCTEDVAHMLDLQGYNCGVDLDALLASAARLEALLGHAVPGQVLRAGKRLVRRCTPDPGL